MILKQIIEIEVYLNDLAGKYTWDEAVKACEELGDGWRVPTREELQLMWCNRDTVGGFVTDYYWSSSEFDAKYAWSQYFHGGFHDCGYKNHTNQVRPVREVKQNEE